MFSRCGAAVGRISLILLIPIAAFFVLPGSLPHWAIMWAVAFAMFLGAKVLSWRTRTSGPVSLWRAAQYFLAYPGMDAQAFLRARHHVHAREPRGGYRRAVAAMFFGAMMFWGIAGQFLNTSSTGTAWLGMIGLVLMLHFGALQLICLAWRSAGVDARPLMEQPLRAASVAEFWGRRWNTAFRDLSWKAWFRPIARRYGARTANWTVFFLSGVIHDIAISLPAGGGYGLPTSYFLLQAAVVEWERSPLCRRLRLDRPLPRRLVAWLAVVGPAGMLFHAPFRNAVILPFMKALGAL